MVGAPECLGAFDVRAFVNGAHDEPLHPDEPVAWIQKPIGAYRHRAPAGPALEKGL